MKRTITLLSTLLILSAAFFLNSCKKEETPVELTLTSLMANTTDLNLATPATDVALDAVITAGFSTAIDPTTATTDNITLMRNYDKTNVDISVSASDTSITITPADPFGTGTQYTLSFGPGLKSTAGKMLTSGVDRSFTTMGTFAVSGEIAHWTFEDNAKDLTGNYDPASGGVIDITYAAGRNDAAGKAAQFNGNTSLIEIPNGDMLENTSDFTLSFWVMADSTQHGQFVMGLAGWYGFQFEIAGDYTWCKLAAQYNLSDTATASEDLWFPGNGQTKDNGGWQGWTFCKDLTGSGGVQALLADKWANVVCTYNSTTKVGTMYINGEKMKAQDFNLWPDGDPKTGVVGLKYAGNDGNNTFVFGFIQDKANPTISDSWADYSNPDNNHFKGMLDDVIIYHKVLTPAEITLMYNSSK